MTKTDIRNKGIASRIKAIRNKLGLTMKEFGKMFDPPASDSIISRWERGVNLPNNERLVKIAEIGNVPFEYLISGNPFDKMSDEEIKEILYDQDYFNSLNEYKELRYPDTKDSLSKSEIYHNKKRLNKKTKEIASKILDVLTEDLEVNYPSSERIEAEHDKIIKAEELLRKKK